MAFKSIGLEEHGEEKEKGTRISSIQMPVNKRNRKNGGEGAGERPGKLFITGGKAAEVR